MKKKNDRPEPASPLRGQTKKIKKMPSLMSPDNLKVLSLEEIERMVHELQVHQIELELQNEEQRRAQEALEVSRARYFDLFDLAPLGYVTVDENGMILEANLTFATLIGFSCSGLTKQPISRFIFKEDQDIYYLFRKKLIEAGQPHSCDLRMTKFDGTVFWAHLTANVAQDGDGAPVCRVVLGDITEQKQVEAASRSFEP